MDNQVICPPDGFLSEGYILLANWHANEPVCDCDNLPDNLRALRGSRNACRKRHSPDLGGVRTRDISVPATTSLSFPLL
jgi:hypothetical protein